MSKTILNSYIIICKFLFLLKKLGKINGGVMENFDDLDRVEIINISDYYKFTNSVEHIPWEILNGKKQTELYLSNSKMTSVSSDISLIKNLALLDLSNNLLTTLCKLPYSLSRINLSCNIFKNFPSSLLDLKNLEYLELSCNQITDLSKTIERFSKLKVFDISHNMLIDFLIDVEKFNSLKTLVLSNNLLIEMETICKIKSLKYLNIGYNKISEIPKNISNLKNLYVMILTKNKIANLSKEIGKCTNLKKLHLDFNLLKEFDNACNIESLTYLNLRNNQILRIPKNISNLKKLTNLFLFNNKISKIPLAINDCKNLKILNLSNNKIIAIHKDLFQKLSNLDFLDIRGNPIEYRASDLEIDMIELQTVMGDRLKIDDEFKHIKKVYEQLKEKKICFNFINLRKCKPLILPNHIFSEEELFEKIEEFQEKFKKVKHKYAIKKINILDPNEFTNQVISFDTKILIDYIHHLYNLDHGYTKWNVPETLVVDFKKYLGAIVFKLFDSDDMLYIEGHLIGLSTAICYCHERQKAELIFLYELLINEDDLHSNNIYKSMLLCEYGSNKYKENLKIYIEETIKKLIGTLKNKISENLFNVRENEQNVHICNYWKHLLRYHVGFDVINDNPIILGHDNFEGKIELGLDAFFQNFTPEWVILEIKDFINGDGALVCKIAEYLYYSDIKNKIEFVECEEDDILFTKCVTTEFCKYILESMEIITFK